MKKDSPFFGAVRHNLYEPLREETAELSAVSISFSVFKTCSFVNLSRSGLSVKLYSQNKTKYQKLMKMVDLANEQLGGISKCKLNEVSNNVYPVRISSKHLVGFIQKWTNWQHGTCASNKELNMECLLQSKEFRKGILDGWYNTDGGNSNRCYTTSPKLVECMEALITSLGKNSIINVSDRRDEITFIREEQLSHNHVLYCVRWYDTKGKRSMKDVYKVKNNSVYFKIKSIEKIDYNDKIYCFEMTNEDEPYFTLPNGLNEFNRIEKIKATYGLSP